MKKMKMQAEFKREANRNYMILFPEEEKRSRYTVQMLDKNQISGLLPFHEKLLDGRRTFYYDITSKQPLSRLLEKRAAEGREIAEVAAGIVFVLRQLEKFLLDEDQLCLDPDYVYVEPDSFQCFLCLIPGAEEAFPDSFQELAQYLLDHVSHNDSGAVVLAFGIFRQSRKENFGVEDIEKELKKYRESGEEGRLPGAAVSERPAGQTETEAASGAWTPVREPASGSGEIVREPVPLTEKEEITEKTERPERVGQTGTEPEEDGIRNRWGTGGLLLLLTPLLFVAPAVLYLRLGISGLARYWYGIVLADAALMAAGLSLAAWKSGLLFGREDAAKGSGEQEKGNEEFEVLFREEAAGQAEPEREERDEMKQHREKRREISSWETDRREDMGDENEFRTVLLAEKPDPSAVHKLISVPGGDEILIRYFPFMIGKNRTICDFCLNRPGVSRLHFKLEETEAGCVLTDLNSTNGTYLNGRLLEANESCPLKTGDEVGVAGLKYRFV